MGSIAARWRVRRMVVTSGVVVGMLVTGACGSGQDNGSTPDVPTVTPAGPSPAAAVSTPPGGVIAPVPAGARALAVDAGVPAVVGPTGTEVLRFAAELGGHGCPDPAQPCPDVVPAPQHIATPALNRLIGIGGGAFLGAGPKVLVTIDADGRTRTSGLGTDDPTALVRTADGRVLVGTANGHVLVLSRTQDGDYTQQRDIGGFVRVDAITVSPRGADLPGEQVIVVDRAQSSITPLDIDDGKLGPALRAGNGATDAVVDHFGRLLVANTRDGEILGFYGSPPVMRFRYPVPGGPYAVDYDDAHDQLWVSRTANNEVVAYGLSGGEPEEKAHYATVRQPDFVTVDRSASNGVTGLYVLSSTGAGLQYLTVGGARGAATTGPGS